MRQQRDRAQAHDVAGFGGASKLLGEVIGQRHFRIIGRDLQPVSDSAGWWARVLVLLGLFAVQPWLAALAALGLITAAIYSLWMMQQTFQGSPDEQRKLADFDVREMLAMGAMMVALLWLGLYPQPVLDLAQPVIEGLQGVVPSDNAVVALAPGAAVDTP